MSGFSNTIRLSFKLYLHLVKRHNRLWNTFSIGQWVVQDRPGWFCAVGVDMKVEQTIQRVSKGPGGHVMPVLWHSSNSYSTR